MDKNTLGHYGWLVVCILILAIMITLATPFASVIRNGVAGYVDNFKGVATDALDGIGSDTSFGGGSSGLPDGPSEDEPEDSTATVSGASYLYLTDVSETPHTLNVSLTSDTITDFSGVKVTKTGKNLLDITKLKSTGSLADLTIDAATGSLSFTKTSGESTSVSANLKVYLPTGSYVISGTNNFNTSKQVVSLIIRSSSNAVVLNKSLSVANPAHSFEIAESGLYTVYFSAQYSAPADTAISLSNIQLELGEATAFEPYNSQVVSANVDGSVSGLTSLSPNVVLMTDTSDVNISCEYQKKVTVSNNSKSPLISKSLPSINDGDVILLESNAIKKNKNLSFSGNISELGTVIFRHGKDAYATGYLSIDDTKIEVYRHTGSSYVLVTSVEHGLNIQGTTDVDITVGSLSRLTVNIESNGGTFSKNNIFWYGSKGAIEVESVGSTITDVELNWECSDYSENIWFFGDSYFELDSTRWPYYLIKEGYTFLLSGYGGAGAKQMYADFETALTHGTPEYAVWCLGMNNGDAEATINSTWQEYTEKFIATCEANGITPILSTIPNTPTVINIHKNEYVRNSGYRYIDFAAAVGAEELGSSWYDEMLSSDNVHPATLGGKALSEQILIDLPEIKG